jgi:hypothetical protein
MAHPVRIQVKRQKGFRLPAGAVYVGRPTKWGNPFRPGPGLSRERMIAKFRAYFRKRRDLIAALGELRGHDLACWCAPGEPCHADVLLELANRGPARRVKAAKPRARPRARTRTRRPG